MNGSTDQGMSGKSIGSFAFLPPPPNPRQSPPHPSPVGLPAVRDIFRLDWKPHPPELSTVTLLLGLLSTRAAKVKPRRRSHFSNIPFEKLFQ